MKCPSCADGELLILECNSRFDIGYDVVECNNCSYSGKVACDGSWKALKADKAKTVDSRKTSM